ncbi:KAP family P-loop NTPase fold protein [Nocardia sputi]|uniref:KAP family P-loop NTPase fold protein n=1 Tax=Nocardia sputi TaxID=2943705 RepID=UPI0024BE0A64|nr:P-loop NTPase fold protein [Nocardia sputi]
MWADNEADIDLLGFDFLVDTLFVAVTESRLLPLTIGLLGDWGSGKSSLMALTCAELEAEGGPEQSSPYLCVQFSPWQYEDYDDVKVALMNAILDVIDERITDDAQAQEQVEQLRKRLPRLRRYGRKAARTFLNAAPQLAPLAMQAVDQNIDPDLAGFVGDAVTAGARAGAERLVDPVEPAAEAVARERVSDVGSFRAQFRDLMTSLSEVKAVVVFIDDLDRCLPDTVVDTFEAIRLFVNTEKTAFVIAANEEIVQSAIDSRYPELVREGTGLGAKYLEKMLQLRVSVPQLSAPEADTYMNLLLAQLHLGAEQFERVVDKTRTIRAEGNLHVAFNVGICGEVVGEVPPGLIADLSWAAGISEVLGGGLRGNPRQLKRFLNDLMLKYRSAERRGISLERPVLAKLMVLEAQYLTDFQRLFGWQVQAQGPIPELAIAEAAAASEPTAGVARERGSEDGSAAGDEQPPRSRRTRTSSSGEAENAAPRAGSEPALPAIDEDLQAWMSKPHVRAWLRLAPSLASTDLRPYFTYSRDKLSLGVAVARLTQQLQELLTKVQSEVEALRRGACQQITALPPGERAQLVEALLHMLERQPGGPAFVAVLEIAERCRDVVPTICGKLLKLPASAVPLAKVPTAVKRLPADEPTAVAVLDYWQNSEIPQLKSVVTAARRVPRSGR